MKEAWSKRDKRNENMRGEAEEEYRKWNQKNHAFKYRRGNRLMDFEDLPIQDRNYWMKQVLIRKQNDEDKVTRMARKRKMWAKLDKESVSGGA